MILRLISVWKISLPSQLSSLFLMLWNIPPSKNLHSYAVCLYTSHFYVTSHSVVCFSEKCQYFISWGRTDCFIAECLRSVVRYTAHFLFLFWTFILSEWSHSSEFDIWLAHTLWLNFFPNLSIFVGGVTVEDGVRNLSMFNDLMQSMKCSSHDELVRDE